MIGAVATAQDAVQFCDRHTPDLITMDVELPGANGFHALRAILGRYDPRIVMVSAFTGRGTRRAIEALALGAAEVVEKPGKSCGLNGFARRLGAVAQALSVVDTGRPKAGGTVPSVAMERDQIVAIAGSTGAIDPLTRILSALPNIFPPIVVIQHLPPGFSVRLAEHLADITAKDVTLAGDDARLRGNRIHLLPSERIAHIAGGRIKLGPQAANAAPRAADAVFASLPGADTAVVLSGMGRDGANGLAGKGDVRVLIQCPTSCAVDAMPRATQIARPDAISQTVTQIGDALSGLSKPLPI